MPVSAPVVIGPGGGFVMGRDEVWIGKEPKSITSTPV